MGQRLIDATALYGKLCTYQNKDGIPRRIPDTDCDNFPITLDMRHIRREIIKAPIVDAVPVVRCKDCVHGIGGNGRIACTEFCNVIHKPDDFCSREERKENYA